MKKVMFDTDVLMNLLEKKEPEYKSVARILSARNKLKIKVYFSSLTLVKILEHLIVEKSKSESKEIIRQVFQLGKVLGTDDKTFEKALNSSIDDLEFAIQFYTAADYHLDYIISNQTRRIKNKKIPVLSADQFLNVI